MVFPGSRNVSESARPASLELWLFDLDSGEEAERLSMDLLNEEERLRAARFVRASDRRHFAVCRACVKSVIASRIPGLNAQSISFAYGPWGKPRWGDISFSISHSQSLGMLALSPSGPLGCDIEWHSRQTDPVGVASYFTLQERLALAELTASARRDAFFTLWVRKESVGKACGQGLGVGLGNIAASYRPDEPVVRVLPGAPVPPETWWVPAFSLPGGYSAAAALPMSLAGLSFVWHGPFAPLDIFSGKAFRQQPLPFGLSSAAPAGTKK